MSKSREFHEKQRADQQRGPMLLAITIGVLAVVLIGGAIILESANGGTSTSTSGTTLPAVRGITPAPASNTQPVNPSAFGEVANADPANRAWGPADAPIKIEEFVDYQCPACGSFNKNFEGAVVSAFAKTGKVRWEVKMLNFLEQGVAGGESTDGAKAAMCSGEQGKFWQMHNALFANQFGENRGAFSRARLKEMAGKIGVEVTAFDACMASTRGEEVLKADAQLQAKYKVNQTPTFVVNGKVYPGARNVDDFRKIFAEVAPSVKVE